MLDAPEDLGRQIDYLQRAAVSLHERQDGHLSQCIGRLANRLSWIAAEAFIRYGIRVPSIHSDETLISRYCETAAVPEDLLAELILEDVQREAEQLTGTQLLTALLKRSHPSQLRERIAQATAERQEILRKAEEAVCQAQAVLDNLLPEPATQQEPVTESSSPPATDIETKPPETPPDA